MISITIAVLSVLLLTTVVTSNVSAAINKEDFEIVDFGLNENKPYIDVKGKAGGSFDWSNCGDECYYAYVFVTDKGNFATTAAPEGSDGPLYYGVSHFDVKSFKPNECIVDKTASGKHYFSGHRTEYIPHELTFNTVTKAYTMMVSVDDPDDACESGEHIDTIYSSK